MYTKHSNCCYDDPKHWLAYVEMFDLCIVDESPKYCHYQKDVFILCVIAVLHDSLQCIDVNQFGKNMNTQVLCYTEIFLHCEDCKLCLEKKYSVRFLRSSVIVLGIQLVQISHCYQQIKSRLLRYLVYLVTSRDFDLIASESLCFTHTLSYFLIHS